MSSTFQLSPFFLFFLFVLSFSPLSQSKPPSSPYLSPSTFFPNYPQMLQNLKIFIYPSSQIAPPTTSPLSLFHSSLLKSPFLTPHPHLAHLFYLPLQSNPSSRSIARSIRDLRFSSPFWNRTLGADHFYLSSGGIGIESDRNLVELKKNSIQISCFPTIEGRFIPHKDISLPLISDRELSTESQPSKMGTESQPSKMGEFLGFFYGEEDRKIAAVLDELRDDPEFLIESQPLDSGGLAERLERSRFCLFFYGFGRDLHVGQALKFGCVPVVISDRPILDLPFGDVLRWTEIAVFVGMRGGGKAVKHVLERTCGETYETIKELGKMASVHFMWNSSDGYDAFHTVMYQLWMRRHTVRYARRDWI